jgi:hypothetical protein
MSVTRTIVCKYFISAFLQEPPRRRLDIGALIHKSKLSGFIIDCEGKLGAKRVQAVSRWWVMEAPTGPRFCVVRAESADFDRLATLWP